MRIDVRELTFECIIGILEAERTRPQRVIVDAVIDYDYVPGAFLDYAAVAETVKAVMLAERFLLVETALLTLTDRLKTRFPAMRTLRLTIRKPDILPDCIVSVSHASNF